MIDIDLKLGYDSKGKISVRPGLSSKSNEWQSIVFQFSPEKLGFMSRRIVGALPGEKIFFFKNCNVELFNSKVKYISNLKGQTFEASDGTIISGIWSTSLYTSFHNERLFKLVVQCMGDYDPIKLYMLSFFDECTNMYGEPQGDMPKLIWNDRNNDSELRFTAQNSRKSFHIMLTCFPTTLK